MAKNRALIENAKTPDKERMQAARRIVLAEWLAQPLQLSLLRLGPVDLVHLPGESILRVISRPRRSDIKIEEVRLPVKVPTIGYVGNLIVDCYTVN